MSLFKKRAFSLCCLVLNISGAALFFAALYWTNMKSVGKGSAPMWAWPMSIMGVLIYECLYLMLTIDTPKAWRLAVAITLTTTAAVLFLTFYSS